MFELLEEKFMAGERVLFWLSLLLFYDFLIKFYVPVCMNELKYCTLDLTSCLFLIFTLIAAQYTNFVRFNIQILR